MPTSSNHAELIAVNDACRECISLSFIIDQLQEVCG